MVIGAMAKPGALLAIAADERISLWQDIGYQTVGLVIVVGSLGFLAVILAILGKFLRPCPDAAESETAAPISRAAAGTNAPSQADIPPELRAVIVAAVYETLGPRHRIVDIESPHNPQQMAWSMEGRRQIFLSHRVR
jgi:Na+-transporting methylmalonyl-CoA/oxaloacetate decarboxylase gamma subunit